MSAHESKRETPKSGAFAAVSGVLKYNLVQLQMFQVSLHSKSLSTMFPETLLLFLFYFSEVLKYIFLQLVIHYQYVVFLLPYVCCFSPFISSIQNIY
uniref:Uncharacterized protein n=1 Tax=Arundo donax TaxID=35708 RepID=A0A0A8XY54_ARUDO